MEPLSGDETALWHAASRVLDANWTGTATIPSPGLYPHQWSWEAAFTAAGLAGHDPERAARELGGLFRGQWADGMLPHIVFDRTLARDGFFPGPELWRSAKQPGAPRDVETSGLTPPPLHAFAALGLHRAGAPDGFLAALYPALVRQHDHLAAVRDIGGHGLMAICHPWESGMDNSPAWDRPLAALQLPPSGYAPQIVPRALPTGTDYDRYVWLVTTLRDAGYQPGHLRDAHPFLVEDPLVNSVYLASSHALAEIAVLLGEDPVPHRERAALIHQGLLDRLWDPAAGCFRPYDLRAARPLPSVTVSAFGPMLDPDLPSFHLGSLVELLMSARFAGAAGYPVPTCDIQSAAFDRSAFWRGPTWLSANWLLWTGARQHGLPAIADLMYGSSLRLVRQSGFREFFDPFDGTGRGSHDFSPSAAVVLDLLACRRGRP